MEFEFPLSKMPSMKMITTGQSFDKLNEKSYCSSAGKFVILERIQAKRRREE
jgi:hypothetical protein